MVKLFNVMRSRGKNTRRRNVPFNQTEGTHQEGEEQKKSICNMTEMSRRRDSSLARERCMFRHTNQHIQAQKGNGVCTKIMLNVVTGVVLAE